MNYPGLGIAFIAFAAAMILCGIDDFHEAISGRRVEGLPGVT
jgi:hypothetical protein